MPFVLDASVTMAWCFDDEANPYANSVLDRLTEDTAVVPSLWALEVANVLLVAQRRGRVTHEQVREIAGLLSVLPIAQEVSQPVQVFANVLPLGEERGLSAYDAGYLELAIRLALPLATLDDRLREAAVASQVPILNVD